MNISDSFICYQLHIYIHIYQFVFQRNICILFKLGHIKHISFYNKGVFAVTKLQQRTLVEVHCRTLLLSPLISFDLCRFIREYNFQIGWEWWVGNEKRSNKLLFFRPRLKRDLSWKIVRCYSHIWCVEKWKM